MGVTSEIISTSTCTFLIFLHRQSRLGLCPFPPPPHHSFLILLFLQLLILSLMLMWMQLWLAICGKHFVGMSNSYPYLWGPVVRHLCQSVLILPSVHSGLFRGDVKTACLHSCLPSFLFFEIIYMKELLVWFSYHLPRHVWVHDEG